jgi:2-methylcitrate dehydratase
VAVNLAERLADYSASLRYGDIAASVLLEAKKRLLDTLGCAIGASGERPVKVVSQLATDGYRGQASTILGTRTKTTAEMATLVNGLMIRYFDYNDTYLSKEPGHPSDNFSACLATAEMEGRSGKDLLLGMVLAYEIQCRLCDAASLRVRGWDHVCYGLVSCALAAGRLLKLSKDEMTQAVNISLNSHLAMRQVRAGELSEWKGFSFANAARNAVFSALLAREGIRGPSPIFEGEMGFFRQVSGPFELETGSFGGRGGAGFKLGATFIKFFPAEYHAQSAIWAALEIRKAAGPALLDALESVLVETHEAGYTILGKDREKWSPKTRETADHSLPYIVAASLLYGKVGLGTYSSRRLGDQRMRELMEKVEVREDPSLTRLYPEKIVNRVTLRLKDGRVFMEEVDDPKGHSTNPLTGDEVEAKFRSLTRGFMSDRQAARVIEIVWGIDRVEDVSSLIAACAAPKRR